MDKSFEEKVREMVDLTSESFKIYRQEEFSEVLVPALLALFMEEVEKCFPKEEPENHPDYVVLSMARGWNSCLKEVKQSVAERITNGR